MLIVKVQHADLFESRRMESKGYQEILRHSRTIMPFFHLPSHLNEYDLPKAAFSRL
jgi:hypothetical protein